MKTLLDVAKHAGVSRATVSLVCRGSPLVAELTRIRVEKAMQEIGYVYNRSAANLRSSLTQTVGLVIPDIANPIYSDLLAGIEDILTPLGKAVFIADTNESLERQNHFLQRMLEMRVDGLIISTVSGTPVTCFAPYQRIGIPIVQVLRKLPGAALDYAGTDNRRGAFEAAAHLLNLGHRRLAYIGSAVSPSVNRERFQGICDALLVHGVDTGGLPTLTSSHGFGDAAQATRNLLAEHPEVTGILCYNDLIALGATLGLNELGLNPGRDISLVGFDNIDAASNWRPPLTTMSIEARTIGRNAGTLLSSRLENPDAPAQDQVTEARLIARSTSAPPRS